jgi:hypothetical protein
MVALDANAAEFACSDNYFWAMRRSEFFTSKFRLLANYLRLAARHRCQNNGENSYKNSGEGRYASGVSIEPSKHKRNRLSHSELVLGWLIILSPFLAGIPAGWLVYDVYRNTKTIDKL